MRFVDGIINRWIKISKFKNSSFNLYFVRCVDVPAPLGVGSPWARLHPLQGRDPGDGELLGGGIPRLADPDGVPEPDLHAVGEWCGAQPQEARPHTQDGHC